MRLFLYEYVTGGGMLDASPPPALVHEADLMVRALLRDLADLPVEVLTSRDPRLPPLDGVHALEPRPGESPLALYRRGLTAVDAAWPTAPETGGVLEALALATRGAGRVLVGSAPEAVAIAASKAATAERLAAAHLSTIPTFRTAAELPAWPGPWVLKPDDGAGAEDTHQVPDVHAARESLSRHPGRWVAQPWIDGESRSLSLLATPAGVELLAVNRQRVEVHGGAVRLRALEVNALPDHDGACARLGGQVVAAIPGLAGYVGVDLLATPAGPVVVEVNPRLTTSACALRAAVGINLAALVLGLAAHRRAADRAVTLDLEAAHVS
ncbi:MAG: ATP-grasp domain-containing protein [Gemmatimonadales bacterium]